LWNSVEKIEKSANSQLARELDIALPVELTLEQNIALAREYVQRTFVDAGIEALEWTDIVDITFPREGIVGLRSNGTVVASYNNDFNRDMFDWPALAEELGEWTNITAITGGNGCYVFGIRTDGTVIYANKSSLRGSGLDKFDVNDWTEIVEIVDCFNTVGLRADGTIVLAGNSNTYDQLDALNWTDIVAIRKTGIGTVGIKPNGALIYHGRPDIRADMAEAINSWTNIVDINIDSSHYVFGLRADGTILYAGPNYGTDFTDAANWTNIKTKSHR
jgi:hypothetical protein